LKQRVVVVEDEQDILDLVAYHFGKAGFQVLAATDGLKAIDLVRDELPDLIILDLILPGLEGTEVCKALKADEKTKHIPILVLTAKGEEIDRIVGFELGAEDYVVKPFSPRELVLRAKAILKRTREPIAGQDVLRIGDLTIDVSRHRVEVSGDEVPFTSTEFKLLHKLAEKPGRVFTREQLLESVWGYDYVGFTRTVDTHVRRLRRKLGKAGDYIQTVRGVGYRFREE